MTDLKQKLAERKKLKKKTPTFARQEAHVRKRLPSSWRKPRGVHSKMRRGRAGKHAVVKIGYGGPTEVRGLTKEGLVSITVSTAKDLAMITGKAAILSSTIGRRKKLQILEAAKKSNISFQNVKDVAAEIIKLKTAVDKQKLEKKKRFESKKKKRKLFAKKEKKDDKKLEKEETKAEEKSPESKEQKPAEKKQEAKPLDAVKKTESKEKRPVEKKPEPKVEAPKVEKKQQKPAGKVLESKPKKVVPKVEEKRQ